MPRVTIDDISRKEFSIANKGYNQKEVDDFLDDICDEMERMENEIMDLKQKTSVVRPAAQESAAANWALEYDDALIAVEAGEDDYAVAPLADFESTQIIVNNGSRYALTLVNCTLPQAAEAAPEIAYPAQSFEGRTDSVKVSVTAAEGAFPEGAAMVVADVEDEQTLSDIENTVSEDFVEVTRVHAVDISFWYKDNEIEPREALSVVMSVPEVEAQEEAVVVHVDNDGGTEVVDSQGEEHKKAFASGVLEENLRAVLEEYGVERLPPALREIIRLRVDFPNATLQELGERANPPLSKSAVYHRIRRIEQMARDLQR